MSYEGSKLAPARLPAAVPLTTAVNAFSNKVTFPTAVSNIVSTNLVVNSDGAVGTYTSGGVTAATTALTGFTNSVQYGDNTAVRYAYKLISWVTGTTYTFSAYVEMDDGSAPVPGTQSASHDFTIVLAGSIKSTATNCTVTLVSGSLYRISLVWTSTTTAAANGGIVKYTQNSAKPFRIAGYQIEVGSVVSDYIATGASAVTRNEFEVTGLLKATNGVSVTSGTVTLAADPTSALHAATKQYVDGRTTFVTNETPTGTINGTNTAFTLANTPISGSLELFQNGILLLPTTHYTLSGATVTYVSGFQPVSGETHRARYRY